MVTIHKSIATSAPVTLSSQWKNLYLRSLVLGKASKARLTCKGEVSGQMTAIECVQ